MFKLPKSLPVQKMAFSVWNLKSHFRHRTGQLTRNQQERTGGGVKTQVNKYLRHWQMYCKYDYTSNSK